MKTTDFETLPRLAKLLETDGWVIYDYKVTGEEAAVLTIVRKTRKEPEKEGGNG